MEATMPAASPRLILFPELREKKGITHSKSTLRRRENAGEFPRRVRPSPHAVAWVEAEIDAHIARMIEQRDAGHWPLRPEIRTAPRWFQKKGTPHASQAHGAERMKRMPNSNRASAQPKERPLQWFRQYHDEIDDPAIRGLSAELYKARMC